MKIQLDYKIDIEIKEGAEIKNTLSVFYREFTKKERADQKKLEKKFVELFNKAQHLIKKKEYLAKKAELHELNGDFEKSINSLDKMDELSLKEDELLEELEAIGGEDQDAFAEELAKKRFDVLVSGPDKPKLAEVAESVGYTNIIQKLDAAKDYLEKKQSGE